ncbi:MAG: hypothetical protein Q4G67_09640 [Actinomycetia bacterium]|nr:hypothetical protein [Actinomycetes bacterium]
MPRRENTRAPALREVTARTLIAGLLLAVLLLAAPPAEATRGMSVQATTRYVLDLDDEVVRATMNINLRNISPNVPIDGGSYQYFYFESYGVPLPARASNVRASSGGQHLTVDRRAIDGEPGYLMYVMRFPDLLYQESRNIELTFTLEDQPARSDDPTRIGPGYATFAVMGPGDPGAGTVEVEVPAGLEVDSTASSFTISETGAGTTLYTTTEDNLGPGFAAIMSVRSSAVREGRPVTVAQVPLVLVPYPNDPEWADFIEARAAIGLPVLMDLVGQDWPGEIDRIRQDAGSQVRGFDGWYSRSEREIVLGEALDDGILFHELAHAWVNSASIEDRWLSEGLAEFLAQQTTTRTDGSFRVPDEVGRGDEHALALQDWENSPGFRGTETDAWAYPASFQVMTALLRDLDGEDLRDLLAAAITATSAWEVGDQRDFSGGQLRTAAFFDLLEAREVPSALDGEAETLFAEWVFTDELRAQLPHRSQAHEAYAEFTAGGPSWGVPVGLRRAMAYWEFDVATSLMTDFAELPALAAEVTNLAERSGAALPQGVQSDYEDAADAAEFADVEQALHTAQQALRRYEQARSVAAADRNLAAELGARVLRLDETADAARANIAAGDYTASQDASTLTLERAEWAERLGAGIIAGIVLAVVILLAAAWGIWRAVRSRRPDHVAPATTAAD